MHEHVPEDTLKAAARHRQPRREPMSPGLGILAGGGALPSLVVSACRAQGRPCFVLAYEGHTDAAAVHDVPHAWIRVQDMAAGLAYLRDAGVEELVMVGPIRRPSLQELVPDAWWVKAVAGCGDQPLGDAALLKRVVQTLEAEGFRIRGVHSLLEGLLASRGVWGAVQPDRQASSDLAHGLDVALSLGALDVGQAVVVQQGIVLAVEAAEGTDAMLGRCGALRREGPGGILVKASKPSQELRVDLPTIGVGTVRSCAAAGLRGIGVEAGRTLVVDRATVIAAADEAGIFICGLPTASA